VTPVLKELAGLSLQAIAAELERQALECTVG
jgi:hypothetical protein